MGAIPMGKHSAAVGGCGGPLGRGCLTSMAAAAAVVGLTSATALHISAPARGSGGTVLTLEGGIVGAQDLVHFTPLQLGGRLCAPPQRCRPVDYPALPGEEFNQQGADILATAISAATADGEPVTLFGHSQGGQVIHVLLRRWAADPGAAPDPDLVSWVSIGNPENPMGGSARKPGFPSQTPYRGTEVIRQYDGWADWPSDTGNLLAVANAVVGALMAHPNYFRVDLDDPANVSHIPANPDGTPGAVTYMWVPTPVLPLIAGSGVLAPALDSMLRPIVEAGYDRPVDLGAGQDPDAGNPGTGRPPGRGDRRTGLQPSVVARQTPAATPRPAPAAAATIIAGEYDSRSASAGPQRPRNHITGSQRRGWGGR